MIGRRVRRYALELVTVERAKRLDEARILKRFVDLSSAIDDGLPPGCEHCRLRLPRSAADVHLARAEVEVATNAALPVIGRRVAGDPSEAGAQVRLVRRLVLGKPDVPIDPKRRLRGIGPKRNLSGPKPLVQRDAQRFQWLLEQTLVVGLARLEPGAVVVVSQVRKELDAGAAEAPEFGRLGCRRGLSCRLGRRLSGLPAGRRRRLSGW